MSDQPSGYAVIARMLGVDVTVLRAITAQWEADPAKPPMLLADFAVRLAQGHAIAQGLNNTNLWEQAIRAALDPTDIPATLLTQGVPRLSKDQDD
ncbi:MAG: hypothetical protein JWN43_324 [Gammaproteobacteria bacterium]|nr:hypothetical protein [Gammaproteobacteria bacterium]